MNLLRITLLATLFALGACASSEKSEEDDRSQQQTAQTMTHPGIYGF